MKKHIFIALAAVIVLAVMRPATTRAINITSYTGSAVCRKCHEKFHKLWSTSWHGKASRPYTDKLAEKELSVQRADISIGPYRYRAEIGKGEGYVLETGPEGKKRYRIEYIIGGKRAYNFLTSLPNGRYQSLPLGYDGEKREWFADTTADKNKDHANWKENHSGFYTACPSCHVSQYSPSYDIDTGKYGATWTEPGINCESCHGSAVEHVKIARNTPKGRPLVGMGLLRPKIMSPAQRSDLCSICHGHIWPLTGSFKPGERFFDNFNLATLERNVFYPDGRGKGETFTLTNWLMNPCLKSGKLDCIHCHTSSGRYKFAKPEEANNACLPCHSEHVKNASGHSHHQADNPGNRCISCHMAPTYYDRMKQSDHSMLPPTPAATIAFGSPNACNDCHGDKDAAWADKQVRIWYSRDYQEPVLKRAHLIEDARKGVWDKLPEMLAYIQSKDRDEVFATSLIRCMFGNRDNRIPPALLKVARDSSPLVRSAAIQALGYYPSPESRLGLLHAVGDDYCVVRISAAYGLMAYPLVDDGNPDIEQIMTAVNDLIGSIKLHPDQWSSYEEAGRIYQNLGRFEEAEASDLKALEIYPKAVNVMVSLSKIYLRQGNIQRAEEVLRQALEIEPSNAAAFNALATLQASSKNLQNEKKSQ